MGVILQGILGGFSGKVGPVVGGKWKDIDYMRSYVIPSNPNTASQQAVRTTFALLVQNARSVLTTICQPFIDPFQSAMSGFNRFIQMNYDVFAAADKLTSASKVTEGTLTGNDISSATYDDPGATISWTENTGGNVESTDYMLGAVYDEGEQMIYVSTTPVARSVGTISVPIPGGLQSATQVAFLFAYRGTGSELVVSDSTAVGI